MDNVKILYLRKFVYWIECSLSRNNDITYDRHVNTSWLSIAALQAG